MNAIANGPIAREMPAKRHSPVRRAVILVATDGSERSHAAYTAAELIAAQTHARVHVLSVVEPFPPVAEIPGTTIPTPGVEESTKDALRADMVEQLLTRGRLGRWSTEILVGKPARVIAEVAKEREVDLIIIGAGQHGMIDRLLGEETSSNLARVVQRPVLVASPSLVRLPRRVILALDLDQSDRGELVSALELLGSPEEVSVVHVTPRSESFGIDWAEFDDEYRGDVARAYGELVAALASLPGVRPTLAIEHGEAAREINRFAERNAADLIVLGVKRRSPFSVAPGAGIALKVARSAGCSVLLVPKHRSAF
ncbi:MAG TPA: universal stress protein [Gemmatimonadaceae bacterium]|nr:universal stress protein [Gemmatimonadaceae bacterium]